MSLVKFQSTTHADYKYYVYSPETVLLVYFEHTPGFSSPRGRGVCELTTHVL